MTQKSFIFSSFIELLLICDICVYCKVLTTVSLVNTTIVSHEYHFLCVMITLNIHSTMFKSFKDLVSRVVQHQDLVAPFRGRRQLAKEKVEKRWAEVTKSYFDETKNISQKSGWEVSFYRFQCFTASEDVQVFKTDFLFLQPLWPLDSQEDLGLLSRSRQLMVAAVHSPVFP